MKMRSSAATLTRLADMASRFELRKQKAKRGEVHVHRITLPVCPGLGFPHCLRGDGCVVICPGAPPRRLRGLEVRAERLGFGRWDLAV
eukprot:scaffold306494_cov28-Tisochrysis_lutea.AAC.3